ncbi:5-hydroxytryptamine receptor 1A-alpha-like [Neocloeon triangulifer]|uniref:5-hydroxytryptamine receptor 1A-alpha-like n=1 Tax=Neocloeon triangulifer TaxID=2078957 RepID=UPI00286F89ED|nr:5-hydroxytryptamine receptor 1A-alpha-like [Neocloeon triangulifer]
MDENGAQILSEPLSIVILAFIGLLVLCSFFGNAVILTAIHFDRTMQSVGYLFVGSKAVSDLLTIIVVVPLAAIDDLLNYWPFSDKLCEVWMALDVTLVTVPILTLLALGIDRYIHMKYPTFYLSYFTKKTVVLINVAAWLMSSCVFGIPWSGDFHRTGHRHDAHNRTVCIPQYPPALSFTFAALSFVVPSVCMIVIYNRLYQYSKRTTQKFQLMFKTLQMNYPDLDPKIPFLSEQRATNTIGIIMITFIACWTPFFVLVMVRALSDGSCCPSWVFKLVTWIGYSNCVLSPLIYASTNQIFRAAFAKTLGVINQETYDRKVSVEVRPSKRSSNESEQIELN